MHDVLAGVTCREQKGGDADLFTSHTLQYLEAVQLRHHHVHNDSIKTRVLQQIECGLAIVRYKRQVPFALHGSLQKRSHADLVFHDEYAHGASIGGLYEYPVTATNL